MDHRNDKPDDNGRYRQAQQGTHNQAMNATMDSSCNGTDDDTDCDDDSQLEEVTANISDASLGKAS